MDIIDIMLAKAMSGGNSDGTAAAAAHQAVQAAAEARAAVAHVPTEESIVETADIAADKLEISAEETDTNEAKINEVVLTNKKTNKKTRAHAQKMYKSTGSNEDGTMTQKAITAAIAANTDGNGGSMNLGPENAGNIVVVGEDGNISAGETAETSIIEALVKSDTYVAKNALGIEIDYENKTVIRTQEAVTLTMGADFDAYKMYGGRMRCNVADDGFINAFYGDQNYKDDGSNGQVMVYQPKFYYQRIPIKTSKNTLGKIIRKESILISYTAQTGFKLHPIFKDANGEELEYVLLPAYNGAIENEKLTSIAGVKPVSNITIQQAETYAHNRGNGWHITNMAAESANQMLEIIEFGSMNGQLSIENGIVSIPNVSNTNCASQTGSTAALGNDTGAAESTINITEGNTVEYTENGKRAISYRGMENPWGNIWRMIGGVNIYGNGRLEGGVPYICKNFNYDITQILDNYASIGFCLPSNYNWINAMGYGNEEYDWIFMPAECSDSANSIAPVGDNLWTNPNSNTLTLAIIGGSWGFGQNAGPFYYACDNLLNDSAQQAYGASLMYIPTKNNIYNANYEKWLAQLEG